MFCHHCREYDHDLSDGETTLKNGYIVLTLVDNLWNEERWRRNKPRVYRNIYHAHKIRDSRLWGQDVEQWSGTAIVHGRTIRVWAWTHKNIIPLRWEDVRE